MIALILAACLPSAPEVPVPASAWVDSIGFCTHWTYPDTPYGFDYARVRDALVGLGVRHIRDGWSDRLGELAKLGIQTTLVCEPELGTPAEIVAKVRAANRLQPTIEALEGPNEPDLFWVSNKKTYQGKPWPEGPIRFLRDLWVANQALGEGRPKVYGIALGKTYDPGGGSPNPLPKGELASSVDFGNFHPYPGGNPFSLPYPYAGIAKYYWQGNAPSNNLDEWPQALTTYRPPYEPKPMVATETGYSTNTAGGGVSEATHAKYIPRLFAEYFRLGIKRTFSYEFIDEFVDPDGKNREAHFGLLRRDGSPKPAYTALKSLIGLVNDSGTTAFRPDPLDFQVDLGMPDGYNKKELVHHLLLQKRNRARYLLIWHEVSGEDISVVPSKQLVHPKVRATVRFAVPCATSVYEYDEKWNLKKTAEKPSGRELAISVDDRIQVIEIR